MWFVLSTAVVGGPAGEEAEVLLDGTRRLMPLFSFYGKHATRVQRVRHPLLPMRPA